MSFHWNEIKTFKQTQKIKESNAVCNSLSGLVIFSPSVLLDVSVFQSSMTCCKFSWCETLSAQLVQRLICAQFSSPRYPRSPHNPDTEPSVSQYLLHGLLVRTPKKKHIIVSFNTENSPYFSLNISGSHYRSFKPLVLLWCSVNIQPL